MPSKVKPSKISVENSGVTSFAPIIITNTTIISVAFPRNIVKAFIAPTRITIARVH